MPTPSPIDSQSQQPITQPDLHHANTILDSIPNPKDSQPTKLKVQNFKNRVFNLLKIYTQHAADVNPLIQCVKQEMFFSEPLKMQQLLHNVLDKQNVTVENLQHLAEYYKLILLYKTDQKATDSIALQFLQLIKKLSTIDLQLVHTQIISMLKSFAYERKCRLNINFFFFFFRKYQHPQQIKTIFIEKIHEYLKDQKLRNAQKKQLTKILARLDKSTKVKNGKVKKQENDQNEEEEDDIKATNKKQNGLVEKVKKYEQDKIQEEENVQENTQKQVSKQQQEKLQRIKANKKKNRKGNNQAQKPHQNEKNHSHSLKKPHQNTKPQQTPQSEHKNHDKSFKAKNPQQNGHKNHEHSNQKRDHSNSKPKFNSQKNHQKPNFKSKGTA